MASIASTPLFPLFKTLNFSCTKKSFFIISPLHTYNFSAQKSQTLHTSSSISSSSSSSSSSSPNSFRSLSSGSLRLARCSTSAATSNGGNTEELSGLSSDVIVLDVKGMMCEGCAGSVKRMLESQPQVSSATVNLASETATVLPVPETKVTENWQKQVGETLAKHLTNCGFQSNLRGQ